jgi:hypothetical protein
MAPVMPLKGVLVSLVVSLVFAVAVY